MTLKHFMAAQMRKPSGWFGSVFLRRLLNRMNMAVVESTLSRMELEPHHLVLEIGFGGSESQKHMSLDRCRIIDLPKIISRRTSTLLAKYWRRDSRLLAARVYVPKDHGNAESGAQTARLLSSIGR